MNVESWKPIPEFPEYAVSDCGNIKRLTSASGTAAGLVIKGNFDKDGYRVMTLRGSAGMKTIRMHKFVAKAFIGPIPAGKQINHKNGIKFDNRVENLEFVTPAENIRHTFMVLGRKAPSRSGIPFIRLTADVVREIRQLRANGMRQVAICEKFKLAPGRVSAIILKKAYRDLP